MTRRHLSLVQRKAVLNAYKERAEKLIKDISKELNPAIIAELGLHKTDKVAVVIEGKAIEISQFDRETPKYKDICDECLGEKLIDQLLKQKGPHGEPLYKSTSTVIKSKLLGSVNI
jgi:hypothetical protein